MHLNIFIKQISFTSAIKKTGVVYKTDSRYFQSNFNEFLHKDSGIGFS